MVYQSSCFKILLLIFILITSAESGEDKPFRCRELYKYDAEKNPTGDIYGPLYKDGAYANELWCEYRITAPKGYRIKLTFKDLDIVPSDFCSHDTLYIYANEKEYVMATVCGTDIPEPIITDPGVNMVQLLFVSDEMVAGRGFHLHYEASPYLEYCSSDLKVCGNRRCFNESQKCDGVDDCGDGTDEEGCNFPLATVECGQPPIRPHTIYGSPDRIVGGQEAIPGSWPWQISMQHRYIIGSSHSCGGSLINQQWVVTAAHCFKGNPHAQNWRVHIGKHHKYYKDPYEQIRYVERIIVWPDKTGETLKGRLNMNHDIALMKLNAPVKFTKAVQPVCLPYLGWDLPVGSACYATGWGETRGTGANHALKQVDVSVMPTSKCSFNEKSQICVKNQKGLQSTCHGDSGGPLVCNLGGKWYVMGATSFGTMGNFMHGLCAMPGQRTVFMKVAEHADWIKKMIDLYS